MQESDDNYNKFMEDNFTLIHTVIHDLTRLEPNQFNMFEYCKYKYEELYTLLKKESIGSVEYSSRFKKIPILTFGSD